MTRARRNSQHRKSKTATVAKWVGNIAAATALASVPALAIIGTLADNIALISVGTFENYFGAALIAIAVAAIRLLGTSKTAKTWPSVIAIVLTLTMAGLGISTLPSLFRAATTKPEPQGFNHPQSSPLILEGREVQSLSHSNQNLSKSRLSGSTLTDVDFSNTDLSESDFRNTRLINTSLAGANLCAADIRGADLTQARNLDRVSDWRFILYDEKTKTPPSWDLEIMSGPVADTGRSILYTCQPNETRQLLSDGTRK